MSHVPWYESTCVLLQNTNLSLSYEFEVARLSFLFVRYCLKFPIIFSNGQQGEKEKVLSVQNLNGQELNYKIHIRKNIYSSHPMQYIEIPKE